jgi:hypothetical protein
VESQGASGPLAVEAGLNQPRHDEAERGGDTDRDAGLLRTSSRTSSKTCSTSLLRRSAEKPETALAAERA